MALFCRRPDTRALSFVFLLVCNGVNCTTFTFVNKCGFTVWPGILASAGSPKLETTGFELSKGTSRSFLAPTGWSGRFWGRTGCNFDGSNRGSCSTGDCGSGQMECSGAGANPPATLAEFTLGSAGSQDFYDVSLVDGYNLPMIVEGSGGSGACATTGCVSDLNRKCPAELRAEGGSGCRSACEAFGRPEYCCSGAYSAPDTCKPTMYSQVFKTACPKSYSYAYDDATSTFTCTGADYTITFCPNFPSLKSSTTSSSPETTDGSGSGTGVGTETQPGLGTETQPVEAASLANPWMADLAIGNSRRNQPSYVLHHSFVLALSLIFCLINFL